MRISERVDMRRQTCEGCLKWRFVDGLGFCSECHYKIISESEVMWNNDDVVDEPVSGFQIVDSNVNEKGA